MAPQQWKRALLALPVIFLAVAVLVPRGGRPRDTDTAAPNGSASAEEVSQR